MIHHVVASLAAHMCISRHQLAKQRTSSVNTAHYHRETAHYHRETAHYHHETAHYYRETVHYQWTTTKITSSIKNTLRF